MGCAIDIIEKQAAGAIYDEMRHLSLELATLQQTQPFYTA